MQVAWLPGPESMRAPELTMAKDLLDGLLRYGQGQVYGMPVRLVDGCEPQLRYVAHRDPLIFGASA